MHLCHKAVDFIREVLATERLPMELRGKAERIVQDRADGLATTQEIEAARANYESDEINVDEGALTSRADDGVWVNAWVWISPEEAKG